MNTKKIIIQLKDLLKKYQDLCDNTFDISNNYFISNNKFKSSDKLIIEGNYITGFKEDGKTFNFDTINDPVLLKMVEKINTILKKEQIQLDSLYEKYEIKKNDRRIDTISKTLDLDRNSSWFIDVVGYKNIYNALQKKSSCVISEPNPNEVIFKNDNIKFTFKKQNNTFSLLCFWKENFLSHNVFLEFNDIQSIKDFKIKSIANMHKIIDNDNSITIERSYNYHRVLLNSSNFMDDETKIEINRLVSFILNIDNIKDVIKTHKTQQHLVIDQKIKKEDLEMISLFCDASLPKSITTEKFKLKKESKNEN